MVVLRIEHATADFDSWKQAFDSDPVGRARSGVRSYQILRGVDRPNEVMIDLEFETAEAAEALLLAMRGVWERVQGGLIEEPHVRITERIESVELPSAPR